MVLRSPAAMPISACSISGSMRCAPIVTCMRLALAAREHAAVDAAFVVQRHPIAILRGALAPR